MGVEPAPEPEPPRRVRAGAIALALVLLGWAPFLAGRAWTPPEHEFLWTRQVNVTDLPANLAAIERAGAGEQPPGNPYQPEPAQARLIRPTWQALGLLRAAGVPALVGYHLARCALGWLLLLAVYRLACRFHARERPRAWACALAALGGGLSWARTLLTGEPGGWPDAVQPEATVWSSLLDSPHLLLGQWLLVEAALAAIDLARAEGPRAARAAGSRLALAGGLALPDQPFLGPALVGVSALALGLLAPPGVRLRRGLAGLACLGLGLAPGAWALGRALLAEPGFAAWSRGLDSPGLPALLMAAAPLWALAGAGVRLDPRARARWFLGGWALLALGLALSPLPQARRLIEGWTIPLGLLGAFALERVTARAGRRLAVALLIVAGLGSADLVRRQLRSYRDPALRYVHYQPRARWALLRALGARLGRDDVVVADAGTSLWLPALAGCRVVHGHPFQGQPPPGRLEAIAAALREADRAGRAPSPVGALAGVRAVVAVNVAGRGLRTALLVPGGERARVVYLGPPGWGAPVMANEQAAVWWLGD